MSTGIVAFLHILRRLENKKLLTKIQLERGKGDTLGEEDANSRKKIQDSRERMPTSQDRVELRTYIGNRIMQH
jgi:hypothetical protein